MADVTILDQSEFLTFPTPNQAVTMAAVTYQAGILPPRTVYLDKAKLTDETLAAAIKNDIALAGKPTTRILHIP